MKYIIKIIQLGFLALFLFLLAKGKMIVWLALFAFTLVLSLAFGRIYCGYVCPMNTLMIPTEWLSDKLKIKKSIPPHWLKSGNLGWLFLAVSAVSMILAKKVLQVNLPILPFWLVFSVFVALFYKQAVFHNLICPFGVLQKAFGRYAKISKKVDSDACIGCRLCEKACPADAIFVREDKKALIDTALCHQCTECQDVCPKSAIHYIKTN